MQPKYKIKSQTYSRSENIKTKKEKIWAHETGSLLLNFVSSARQVLLSVQRQSQCDVIVLTVLSN